MQMRKNVCFKFFLFLYFFPSFLIGHELSVCAIFRDEARFMKEWIEYHLMVGVEHFYLYNNLSTDNYSEILDPYLEKGIVDLIEWNQDFADLEEWNTIQCTAYTDCIQKTRDKDEWLAFIDLDEFIVPVVGNNAASILKNYKNYSGLGVNWQCYGSSDVYQIPEEKLLIETLLKKGSNKEKKHQFIKSIIRPKFTSHCTNPHWVHFLAGYHVNEDKVRCNSHLSPYISTKIIRINHYWSRDKQFLYDIKLPRMQRIASNYTKAAIDVADQNFNVQYDSIMLKFVDELRQRMGY